MKIKAIQRLTKRQRRGEKALQRKPQSKKARVRLDYGRSSDSPPI